MAATSVGRSDARLKAGPRPLLFVLGVAMALIAFGGVFTVGTLMSAGRPAGELVVVQVAARDILFRETIVAAALTTARLPSASLPPGTFTRATDLAGDTAQVTILKGQPISSNLVATSPEQLNMPGPAYLPIPAGWVAITIPSNEQQGVGGYIAPGDYIDVLATLNTTVFDAQVPRAVTKTIFGDVQVIRLGPPSSAAREGQRQGVAGSLTVVLSKCDAQFMSWFIANANLRYVLKSHHDYGSGPAAQATPCPTTSSTGIGPTQVDARYAFTKI